MYQQREGHFNVLQSQKEGYKNPWILITICTQHHAKKNGSLDKKYQHRLEDVVVQWVVQSTWDDMLHCLYNKTKEKDTERQAKENRKLYDGCQRKLNELGVLWKIR